MKALKPITLWDANRMYPNLQPFLEEHFPETLWEIVPEGVVYVRKAEKFSLCDQETAHARGQVMRMQSGWIVYPPGRRVYRDELEMSRLLPDGASVSNVWLEESSHDPGGRWYSVQITNNGGRVEKSTYNRIKML